MDSFVTYYFFDVRRELLHYKKEKKNEYSRYFQLKHAKCPAQNLRKQMQMFISILLVIVFIVPYFIKIR